MISAYLEELQQDPFDSAEFIERLTWRTQNEMGTDQFDPVTLHHTFSQAISDLKVLQKRQQQSCKFLEDAVRDEQAIHAKNIEKLQEKHEISVEWFHQLDEKINSVAGKIIHLGEQLENVNTPRSRTVEAQRLLNHMREFLMRGPIVNDLFSDKTRLFEAADVIQKLYTIAQDLPADKFSEAKRKIEMKYDEIERNLIEEFATAQKQENIEKMRTIASILSQFKGYSQCIDAYIEQSQMTTYGEKGLFAQILPMCRHHYSLIKRVFSSPDQVMSKFILNIYHLKLFQFAQTKLEDRRDDDKYLRTLYDLYSQTRRISADLAEFEIGMDDNLLSKLTTNIFVQHLATYIEVETRSLNTKCSLELKRYYESKKHQKKQAERFQDLRRDVQAFIGTRANINIAQIDDYGGETFISEELAINLLQESKAAFKRCRLLSKEDELPSNMIRLADILLRYLMHEHVDYAIELGLQAIPIAESKVVPQIYFFEVVQKSNTIVHLLEKLYAASVIPCVESTPKYTECLTKKRYMLEQIETKLDTGLDRAINAIVGWVKTYLQSEQRKTDFKPESDYDTLASSACQHVVQQIIPIIKQIQKYLDGENLKGVINEIGVRLHRTIYEHLQQFQYTTAGAMCAICDVNEYRKCVRVLNSPLVTQLFDILHALCNLLLVKHENLQEVCGGDTLNYLDKSVVLNFIQLRSDYKTIKITNSLKGISEQRV